MIPEFFLYLFPFLLLGGFLLYWAYPGTPTPGAGTPKRATLPASTGTSSYRAGTRRP